MAPALLDGCSRLDPLITRFSAPAGVSVWLFLLDPAGGDLVESLWPQARHSLGRGSREAGEPRRGAPATPRFSRLPAVWGRDSGLVLGHMATSWISTWCDLSGTHSGLMGHAGTAIEDLQCYLSGTDSGSHSLMLWRAFCDLSAGLDSLLNLVFLVFPCFRHS